MCMKIRRFKFPLMKMRAQYGMIARKIGIPRDNAPCGMYVDYVPQEPS